MELPQNLRRGLDALFAQHETTYGHGELKAAAAAVSERYRTQVETGGRLIASAAEALAYALSRMPATYAAALDALEKADPSSAFGFRSVLDVGSGTGAAVWAVGEWYAPGEIVCLDADENMLRLSSQLLRYEPSLRQRVRFERCDAVRSDYPMRADLVVSSYMLGELTQSDRMAALRKMWDAAKKALLLILPGTPRGYAAMLQARGALLGWGGHIAAPCPHEDACPVCGDDWCHFSCRVPRSRIHRQLKEGDAPYEDEKYSYIFVCRLPPAARGGFRVLRHPRIQKGFVQLVGCEDGGIVTRRVTRRNGDAYRAARRAAWGDLLREEKSAEEKSGAAKIGAAEKDGQ